MRTLHEKRAVIPLDGPSHNERKNTRLIHGNEFDSIVPGENPWSALESTRRRDDLGLLLCCLAVFVGQSLTLVGIAAGGLGG